MPELIVKEVDRIENPALGYIFNRQDFQSLKPQPKVHMLLSQGLQTIAGISFTLIGNEAVSGYGATFGSYYLYTSTNTEQLIFLLTSAKSSLLSKGIQNIVVKHRPRIYDADDSDRIFGAAGFQQLYSEVDQFIEVDEVSFVDKIRKNERKKLRQSLDKGFSFLLLDLTYLEQVYALVTSTRQQKGYPTSMTLAQLRDTIAAMPNDFLLFGLFDRDILVAASVSIMVAPQIMYNFYHADNFSYRSISPLVLLLDHIYQYCRHRKVSILDLGISSYHGELNQGLFKFKENVGCLITDKITYSYLPQ